MLWHFWSLANSSIVPKTFLGVRQASLKAAALAMNAKQSCESPMPMIFGCDKVFILSSYWSAVLAGRNQLFETMKREAVLVC